MKGRPEIATENVYSHPVFQRALASGHHWSSVVPIVLYWDGARATKNEAFEGFYFHDLRTRERCLLFSVLQADVCVCAAALGGALGLLF